MSHKISDELTKVHLAITKNGYKLRLQLLDDAFEVKDKENLKFKGRPRKELHEAWGGLLARMISLYLLVHGSVSNRKRCITDMNVRIRPDEVQKSPGFTSIEINDGSGDLAAFPTVFHSIHCLVSLCLCKAGGSSSKFAQ